MVESNLDPPEEKKGLFVRMMYAVTPKRYQKYLTKEAFVAWNVSSVATDLKWIGILAVPWDVVMPVVRMYWTKIVGAALHGWKVFKEAIGDFITILNAGT